MIDSAGYEVMRRSRPRTTSRITESRPSGNAVSKASGRNGVLPTGMATPRLNRATSVNNGSNLPGFM
jgi:hypothetical protein